MDIGNEFQAPQGTALLQDTQSALGGFATQLQRGPWENFAEASGLVLYVFYKSLASELSGAPKSLVA